MKTILHPYEDKLQLSKQVFAFSLKMSQTNWTPESVHLRVHLQLSHEYQHILQIFLIILHKCTISFSIAMVLSNFLKRGGVKMPPFSIMKSHLYRVDVADGCDPLQNDEYFAFRHRKCTFHKTHFLGYHFASYDDSLWPLSREVLMNF